MINKIILIFFTTCFLSCKGQKTELIENIDQEISETINIINFSSIKISQESIPEKEVKNQAGVFKSKNIYKPSFFDVMDIQVTNECPNSYIFLNLNEQNLCDQLGFDLRYFDESNKDQKPKFQVQKVIYANGDIEEATKVLLTNEQIMKLPFERENENIEIINSGLYFYLNNYKPVVGVEVKVTTNFPISKDYIVEKNQKTFKIDNIDVSIIKLNDNEITYSIPTELADKIEVNTLYKNGKNLKCIGSQTFSSNYQMAQLKSYIKALEKAKTEVVNQKITTKEEVKRFVEANTEKSTLVPDKTTTFSKYFSTKIDKIVISVLQKNNPVEAIHTYYIPKFQSERIKETGYKICVDTKTKKNGIIGLDGNWIIQPIYHFLHDTNYIKNIVSSETDESDNDIDCWIDKKNKKLVKLSYETNSYSLAKNHPRLFIVEKNVKGTTKLGIADNETGKLVIPAEYEFITFSNDKILCKLFNQKGIKTFSTRSVLGDL